ERDHSIFAGLDLRFGPLEKADYVVCSGLFDDGKETPDDYRPRLETMLKRKLRSGARPIRAACWRSATRCARTWPVRTPSASIAYSSPPASTPKNWAA